MHTTPTDIFGCHSMAIVMLQLLVSVTVLILCHFHVAMSFTVAGLNVKLNVKPDRRVEFLDVITMDGKETLANEPGALQFVMGEDTSTENIFYLHEQYKSQEDLKYHESTPHFKKWQEFCATNPFQEDPIKDVYECQHDPVKIPVRSAFSLNVELCIKPQVREEFLKVINNNQKGSRAEPLCLQYDYGESTETPNSFYFHEQYMGKDEGKEGFDAHAIAPHFVKWEEFAATDPFTKPPRVSFFKNIM
jgi:quinol monooxygenase YgiN